MSKFQLGDKVQQSATSTFRYGTASNPVDVTGVIVEVRGANSVLFPYRVEWPNDKVNAYRESDLELVEAKVDVIASAKRLHELREQQASLSNQITELADQIRITLEGTGLTLVEDIVHPVVTLQTLESEGKVLVGQRFLCNTTHDQDEHVVGKVYAVLELDKRDVLPVKLESEDGEGWWVDAAYLGDYTKVN